MEVCAVNTAVEANEIQDRKKRSRSKKVLGKGVLFPTFVGLKIKMRTEKWVLTGSAPSWKNKKKGRLGRKSLPLLVKHCYFLTSAA